MLIVANVYIGDVLHKQRHSVIITVAVHFNGGDSTKCKANHLIYKAEGIFFEYQFNLTI